MEIEKKQSAAIKAFDSALKKIKDAGLIIAMADGYVHIYHKSEFDDGDFDAGTSGLHDKNGVWVESLYLSDEIVH